MSVGIPFRVRVSLVVLAVLTLACTLGPLLQRDPTAVGDVLSLRFRAPLTADAGGWHLFGTDAFGRDVLGRLLLAGRLSLLVGVAGAVLSGVVGTVLGAVAGWRAGVADTVITSASDTLQAIPRLVLLLACAALWRPGIPTLVTVLALTGWMGVARLVRAEVLGLAGRDFVASATVLGASSWRTLTRHVIPNAVAPALVATTLGIGNAILLESGLSFLGLGVQPPAPSWGNMIAGGREHLVTAPWVALAPGLAVVATVTAATLVGDWLQARAAGRSAAG
ncbi:MAG: ABC transporter permease [Gemmatimonadaceae bacterium]|nr:ABC transporter permease [Gemmatimonadaceae bacterium]